MEMIWDLMDMKKFLLIFVVGISMSFNEIAHAQFTDIQKDSLDFMYSQQLIDGYPDGSFKPEATINRAELIKMIMKAVQIEAKSVNNNCFKDVHGDDWYVVYVCSAKENGWVNGYSDATFRPGNPVNKAEAFKIISNILGLDSGISQQPLLHSFSDVKSSSWYSPYVNALSQNYSIDWTKYLYPNQPITREQAAEILFRNLLAEKLYAPLEPQGVFDAQQIHLTAAESLGLAARDFFRVPPLVKGISYDQLLQEQQNVIDLYNLVKITYAGSSLDFEQWNYQVLLKTQGFTYGVIQINDKNREMLTGWRDHYDTWAIVKFNSSNALVAYDFFTRRVDRPSLAPNITTADNDTVEISLGESGPDPAFMSKNGDKISFTLVNFR